MKISRKTLAKGVRLTREMVTAPLHAIANALSSLSLDGSNLVQPRAPFRVSFTLPLLDSRYFTIAQSRPDANLFCLPFVLPPLQEEWGTPSSLPILDELSVSFDQRGEPAAIDSATGKLNYDATNQYDLTVSLVEKSRMVAPYIPEREVVSVHLTPPIFTGAGLNPFVLGNLNKQIDPNKTYALMISAPKLSSTALPNLVVSFRFTFPLVSRDSGVEIQNLPLSHLGEKTPEVIVINDPMVNQQIRAESSVGIHTNVAKLDQRILGKLDAGMTTASDVPPVEHLSVESCYEVIVVPVWGGFGTDNCFAVSNAIQAPYAGTAPFTQPTGDRRLIRLSSPMTIHHVIAVVNYQNPRHNVPKDFPDVGTRTTVPKHPSSAALLNKVGVAICTGMGSDQFAYQQIASVEWSKASKAAKTIDRFKNAVGGVDSEDPTEPWDSELISVPMVYRSGLQGTGYTSPTGKPFFVGKANNKTRSRTTVGTMVGGTNTAVTAGEETFLEVRWTMQDDTGLDPKGGNPNHDVAPVDMFGTFGAPMTDLVMNLHQIPTDLGYDTSTFTREPFEPLIRGNPGGHSGWWDWTAPVSCPVIVTTAGSDFRTLLGVYTGNAVNALTGIVTQIAGGGVGDFCSVSFNAIAGTTYRITVDGYLGATGLAKLSINAADRQDEVYAGQGGNFVLLVGKKSLITPEG